MLKKKYVETKLPWGLMDDYFIFKTLLSVDTAITIIIAVTEIRVESINHAYKNKRRKKILLLLYILFLKM